MTIGNPRSIILKFTASAFLGLLVQELYGVVDGIALGQFVGDHAFAAVSSVSLILLVVTSACSGLSSAICSVTACCVGEGDRGKLRRHASVSLFVHVSVGVILSAVCILAADALVFCMHTPTDLAKDAAIYLRVSGIRILPVMLFDYALYTSHALGNSRMPSKFMLASSVINAVLDVVFVGVFHLEVTGAALATLVADLICLIPFLGSLWYKQRDVAPSFDLNIKEALHLFVHALPMGIQSGAVAMGGASIQYAVNSLGTIYVTAYSAGYKSYHILSCAFTALGQTVSVYCGQNYGANNMRRVRNGVRSCLLPIVIFSAFSLVVLTLVDESLTRLFMPNVTTEVMKMCSTYIFITTLFFIPLGVLNVFRNALQGLGHTALASTNGIIELVSRTVFSVLIIPKGFMGVCLCFPVTWIISCAYLIPAYYISARREVSNGDAISRL